MSHALYTLLASAALHDPEAQLLHPCCCTPSESSLADSTPLEGIYSTNSHQPLESLLKTRRRSRHSLANPTLVTLYELPLLKLYQILYTCKGHLDLERFVFKLIVWLKHVQHGLLLANDMAAQLGLCH